MILAPGTGPEAGGADARRRCLVGMGAVLFLLSLLLIAPDVWKAFAFKFSYVQPGDEVHYFFGSLMLRMGVERIYDYETFARFYGPHNPVHSVDEFVAYLDYPPLLYLAAMPLTLGTIPQFVKSFFVLNVACLVVSAGLLGGCVVRWLGRPARCGDLVLAVAACLLLVFFYSPTIENLMQGQANILLLLLFSAFALACATGRDTLAGVLAGLAGSVKIFPLFLLFGLFVRGRFKAVVAGLMTPVVIYGAIALLWPSLLGDYFQNIFPFYLSRQIAALPFNRSLEGGMLLGMGLGEWGQAPAAMRYGLAVFKLACMGLGAYVISSLWRAAGQAGAASAVGAGEAGLAGQTAGEGQAGAAGAASAVGAGEAGLAGQTAGKGQAGAASAVGAGEAGLAGQTAGKGQAGAASAMGAGEAGLAGQTAGKGQAGATSAVGAGEAGLAGQTAGKGQAGAAAMRAHASAAEVGLGVALLYLVIPSSWQYYHVWYLLSFVAAGMVLIARPLSRVDFVAGAVLLAAWFLIATFEGLCSVASRPLMWWMRWYWYQSAVIVGVKLGIFLSCLVVFWPRGAGLAAEERPQSA